MPELPEVETVRRGLEPFMAWARFGKVELRRKDLRFPFPEGFADRLNGARIESLARRGKYLLAGLSTGECLIMHLGMSGRFTVKEDAGAGAGAANSVSEHAGDPKHDHVVFSLEGKGIVEIIYNDPRRFGFMDLVSTDDLESCRHFKGMGPEPLGNDFTAAMLSANLKRRSAPIKAALLDQRTVAGLGNIYVCEALYRARISPKRKAASVAGVRAERLHHEIISVLRDAVDAGGSSLRDFASVDGGLGYFQHEFEVYGRGGEPCRNCGAPIKQLVQSGRSTFYCSRCQR